MSSWLQSGRPAAAALLLLAACCAQASCGDDDAPAPPDAAEGGASGGGAGPMDAAVRTDARVPSDGQTPREGAVPAEASAPDCKAPSGQGTAEAGFERLVIEAPDEPPPGLPFTIAVRTASGAPLSGDVTLCAGGEPVAVFKLYRGRGSAPLVLPAQGEVTIAASAAGAFGERVLRAAQRPREVASGTLGASDLLWSRASDTVVRGDAIVPAGSELVVEAGARVLLEADAGLIVHGALRVRGSADDPVLFTRAGEAPWGGIRVEAGGSARLEHAWLTSGGGNAALAFGHSDSQPVLFASEAELTMTGGGMVDNPGKAFGSVSARVTLDGVLVSRCDTGGQLNASRVLLQNAHILELPDADGRLDDDDNDGIYLSGAALDEAGDPVESVIRDTVFALGEDDAIDHNNAQLRVERTWIEDFRHEGIAASNGRRAVVVDSVVRGCEQGIEAGYGSPEVVVEHCLVFDNGVGLRFGDSYDDAANGTLTVSHTISFGNRTADVRNHVDRLGGPRAGAIRIQCSIVGVGDDGTDAGSTPAEPEGDFGTRGCASGPVLDGPGCGGTIPGPRVCF